MRHARTIVIAGLCLLAGRPLAARTTRATSPTEPADTGTAGRVGCTIPADGQLIQLTLPIDVLDQLERLSKSTFVHAFLIRHIAQREAGDNRLSRCARNFLDAKPSELAKLRANYPDASEILDALRTAELARLQTKALADSSKDLLQVLPRLLSDTSASLLVVSAELLHAALARGCDAHAVACRELPTTSIWVDSVRAARANTQARQSDLRSAGEELSRVQQALAQAQKADEEDAARLQLLQADTTQAEVLRHVQDEIGRRKLALDSLNRQLSDGQSRLTGATQAQQAADTAARRATDSMRASVQRLTSALKNSPVVARTKVDTAALRGIASQSSGLAAPPATASTAAQSAGSASLVLALTEFIIARARQEAVNSFVINLHKVVKAQPLLRWGFPDTWGLMDGLAKRGPDLDAVAVGRIPLSVWRATLAGDFVRLPLNLVGAGPAALCPSADRVPRPAAKAVAQASKASPAAAAGTGEAASAAARRAERERCIQRVAALQPLAPLASRLLAGDPVFDVLRDAAWSTFSDRSARAQALREGMALLAAVAEIYAVQGYAPAADPVHQPYILTASTLHQLSTEQRQALVRLLVLRAVAPAADDTMPVDADGVWSGVATLAGTLERIAARPASGDTKSADPAAIMHSTFDALAGGVDLAKAFATPRTAIQLDTVKDQLRAVGGALEPLLARDFGLALSRTVVLVRELRGSDLPPNVVTFAALASSLTEAKNGDDVRRAFESAASPVGGWQAKRFGDGGATITAYPGFALGWEELARQGKLPWMEDGTGSIGVAMPIGIEFRHRRAAADTAFHGCSFYCGTGLFFPIIDPGALLSYRIGGARDVESVPNTTLRQVFAPGIYASVALTRTIPLTLLLGAQFMPALRKVDQAGAGTTDRHAVRFGAAISADVTLFRF